MFPAVRIVILSENGNARWEGTKNKDVCRSCNFREKTSPKKYELWPNHQ
jgi:hypothetical protein